MCPNVSIDRDGESFHLELMNIITYTADFQTAANKMDRTCESTYQCPIRALVYSSIQLYASIAKLIHLLLSDAIKSSVIIETLEL